MTNLFKLVFLNIKVLLNFNKFKSLSIFKKSLFILLGIYIIASVIGSLIVYSNLLYDYLSKFNLTNVMMPGLLLMTSLITLFFAAFNAKNLLFDSKDDSIIMSLPITERTVFIARLFTLYLLNFLSMAIILMPMGLYYGIMSNQPFKYYLILKIIIIFIAIIPTIINGLIGYLTAKLTSKFNRKNIVEILISFILVIGLMLFISNVQTILKELIDNKELIIKIIKYAFYPIYISYEIFNEYSLYQLLIFILIHMLLIISFVYVTSKKYYNVISNLKNNPITSKFHYLKTKSRGIIGALVNKEFKKYITTPVYILNTSFGLVLMLLLAIGTFFYDTDKLLKLMDLQVEGLSIEYLILGLVMLVPALSSTTNASISLEGNSFWILKSSPIRGKDIFLSKISLNLLVVIPIAIISLIILSFNLNLSLTTFILYVLIIILMTLFAALFGLYINLVFPVLNYTSEVQVVKQSVSSLISILVPMIVIMVSLILFQKMNIYLIAILIIGALIFINSILTFVLSKHGLKLYNALS